MQQPDTPDLVIIGGGIAGGAMATVMARAGHSVLMLEITEEHRDVVRGEWIAPWGVLETKRLGLYDLYLEHGGHHLKRHITYDEDTDPAEAISIELTSLVPGAPGPLCLGHPKLCNILNEAAVGAGAKFLRGVRKTEVVPGARPAVRFEHQGTNYELRPKLVIGADGRHGKTYSQAGITRHADAQHHLFSGMLIEGAHDWPDDLQCIATEGDVNVLVFPQGEGRVRLYQGVASDQRARFIGEGAPAHFVREMALDCIPGSEILAAAQPASQPFVYPNNDTWTDEPFAAGVVLIGDAAGHNDPIIGQGQSITHRDVRIVSDILKSSEDWSPAAFAPYAEERRERMRRLRLSARFISVRDCEFGEAARARRASINALAATDPTGMMLGLASLVGPENVPAEFFSDEALARALAA